MKKVLVFGGTRFFGKQLVKNLIKEGYDVTIATRGIKLDSFEDKVKRISVDREDRKFMKEVFKNKNYDIVFDNICYSPNSAQIACDIFNDRIQKYIFTSTMSVYEYGENMKEEEVNTLNYEIKYGEKEEFDYGEGKRQAEAVFFQKAKFPVVAVRFPFVIGLDDYTKRLFFYPENIFKGNEMLINNLYGKMSVITSKEAAKFLLWSAKSEFTGPINCNNNGDMIIKDVIHISESKLGKKAIIANNEESCSNKSPFNGVNKFSLDNSYAKKLGFVFEDTNKVLNEIIEGYAEELK